MVLRTFVAFDNDALTVADGSPFLTPGSAIINNSDTPNGTVFTYSSGFGTTVTLDDDENRNIFDDDEEDEHEIVDGGGIVAAGAEVESESRIDLRALDENGNPTGPVISIWVFSQEGQTSNVWGFATNTPLQNGVSYVKVGGSNNGDSRYADYAVCFGPGTRLDGPEGPVAIEDVAPGLRLWTEDDPDCEVTWVGRVLMPAEGALAPVVIEKGALGNTAELVVSQQHRMLVTGAAVELVAGHARGLVAAKHLVGLPGVTLRQGGEIVYSHVMFDRHRIVRANGCLCESFFPAEMSLSALDRGPKAELFALFPDLRDRPAVYGPTAAPVLLRHEAAALRALSRAGRDRRVRRRAVPLA